MTPEKPNKTELALWDNGGFEIKSIEINYRQTGIETGDTFCKIKFSNNYLYEGRWKNVEGLIDICPDFRSLAKLKSSVVQKCDQWRRFLSKNEEEHNLYLRLKNKFEK